MSALEFVPNVDQLITALNLGTINPYDSNQQDRVADTTTELEIYIEGAQFQKQPWSLGPVDHTITRVARKDRARKSPFVRMIAAAQVYQLRNAGHKRHLGLVPIAAEGA